MKIILSGSSGFVGNSFVKSFNNRYDFNFIKRKNASSFTSSNILFWDELNKDQLAFPIIHLAGKSQDSLKVKNRDEYYQINTELTKNIFDLFLQSESKIFIYISSVKAVHDSCNSIMTEDFIPNPTSDYGRSKLLAEQYIFSKDISPNKRVFILRPTLIHGPGNKGNLNLLYNLVSRNLPWPLGAFENKRSFCSIDNFLFVLSELIERDDIPSGIYNVADDEPISTNDLISLIAQSQNKKPKIWNVSKGFINFIAKIGDKLHLPINTERLQKLTDSYVVSNAKLKNAIGKNLPFSTREGLLRTFLSFKR